MNKTFVTLTALALLTAAIGFTTSFAQDGSTGGSTGTDTPKTDTTTGSTTETTPAPTTTPESTEDLTPNSPWPEENIDTGDVGGPISWGFIISQPNISATFVPGKIDPTPVDRQDLQLVPGTLNAYECDRITGVIWEKQYDDEGNLITAINPETGETQIKWSARLGTSFCAIATELIQRVESDCTGQFMAWETTRLYLSTGGYIIIEGPADGAYGHRNRWLAASGRVGYPARVEKTDYVK